MLLARDNPLVSVRGIRLSVARQGGLPSIFFRNPGFRFAPPGATCFRPQSRATINVIAVDTPASNRRSTADRVFFGSVVFTSAITLVWLFFVVTQYKGRFFFGRYNVDAQVIGRVLA